MVRKWWCFRREQRNLEVHTCKTTAQALALALLTGVIYYTSNFYPKHSFQCLAGFVVVFSGLQTSLP